ncbi:MAG: thioredoxin family protein [Archaeoglobaceae archaeon]
MRYVALAIALALIALAIFSNRGSFDESRWYDFEEGMKLSAESGRDILVFISKKDCPTCAEFKRFFSNEENFEKLESLVIPVFVEWPRDELPVRVTIFPTFCVGNAVDFPRDCKTFASPDDFMEWLNETV